MVPEASCFLELSEKASADEVSEAVGALVRASLKGSDVRDDLASSERILEQVFSWLEHYLAKLAGFQSSQSGAPLLEDTSLGSLAPEEAAGAACLKLLRNLCVGRPEFQARCWRRGLVERLAVQARADTAAPGGERGAAWCEAVPSFMANMIAGNQELRSETLEALFPHGFAAVLALCWRRPDHAFILAQNLFAEGGATHLVATREGHCVLYLLLSLLASVGEIAASEAVVAKATEWATIFFSKMWSAGYFTKSFLAVRELKPSQLHSFLCSVAAVPGWGALHVGGGSAEAAQDASLAASACFGQLLSRLCGHREALGLLWHTVHGLLGGPSASSKENLQNADCGSTEAERLASQLLMDTGFVDLAIEEMLAEVTALAWTWKLELVFNPVPADACAALGLEPSLLDWKELSAETKLVEGNGSDKDQGENAESNGYYREMLLAAIQLAAIPRKPGFIYPARLVGLYLSVNITLIEALHRLRFGTAALAATGVPLPPGQTSPTVADPAKAVKASLACELVNQLRLIGNLLYNQPQAADFLRLSGGLSVLLSHCYADPELPLLREAGVFALRNATKHNMEVQREVKELLAQRRSKVTPSNKEGDDAGYVGDMSALPSIDETAFL